MGKIFERYGAKLTNLDVAPAADNLKNASVYIIVDPDHVKDNPKPNYISANDIKVLSNWVKAGGVLLLMANDSANCELEHFSKLASVFGITFTSKSINMVKNDVFEQGTVLPGENNLIFQKTKKMYLKEVSVLKVQSPAEVIVEKNEDNIIAVTKSGKGTVIAIGDPWLYNEYVDGRKLPADYENYKAAEELVKWLLKQTK
jgi:unsaturated rhamnogalacturonyl hydrolase